MCRYLVMGVRVLSHAGKLITQTEDLGSGSIRVSGMQSIPSCFRMLLIYVLEWMGLNKA